MATSPATDFHRPAGVPVDGILLAEELLDLAERAQAYTNAAGVVIALMRGKELLVRTSAGSAPEVGTAIPSSDAFIAECLQRRKPLSCRDTDSDPRVGPVLRASKTRSLIAIPIPGQPLPRGVMLVIAPLPNAFQPTHIAILMTLSDIISSKLAAREAPPDVQVEVVDDPVPALLVTPEPAPKRAIPEMPVIAAAPVMPAPPAARVTPPFAAVVAPAPIAAAPAPVQVDPKPDMAAVQATSPTEAAAEPATSAPDAPPLVPPCLLKTGPLPLVQEKKAERDPGLLSPSEDPRRFKTQNTFAANTIATARPELVKVTPKPVAPVVVSSTPTAAQPISVPALKINPKPLAPAAVTAAPPRAEPIRATASSAAAIPALAAWEVPQQESSLRRFLVPALAVAVVLVVAAALWMRRSTSTETSVPQIPVPAAAAVTQPAPAPAAATSVQPPIKIGASAKNEPLMLIVDQRAQPKPSKPSEAQAAPAPAKHGPAPAMEIAAAKPKLEAEPEAPAPKLTLASSDGTVATLSKMAVAIPAPPKSELVQATLISRTQPVYPAAARQLGISGTVVLNVAIAADGSVSNVQVVEGAAQLRTAAINAVRQWRYSPATLNGKPVESSAHVQVKFTR